MYYSGQKTRNNNGSTATDGYIWYPNGDYFCLGSQYKASSVSVSFSRLSAWASSHPVYNAEVRVVFDDDSTMTLGYIGGGTNLPMNTSTYPGSLSGVIDLTSTLSESNQKALCAKTIARIDLGTCEDQYGGERDIRCSGSSVCDFTFYYDLAATLSTPGTPTIGTDGNGNYTVSWTAASASGGSGSVSYVVHYGPEDDTVSAGTATSKTIAIPASYYNTAISFFIEASYSGLTATSSSSSYTAIRGTIAPPSNVKLNSTTSYGEQVVLSWTSPGNGSNNALTGFAIERREYDGSAYGEWTSLSTVEKNVTSLSVDVPATVNHKYQFRVKALGEYSNSSTADSSNLVTRLAQGKCSVPSTFKATEVRSNNKYFYLIWEGALGGENNSITGYEIQRCTSTNNGVSYGSWTSLGVFGATVSSLHLLCPTAKWTRYKYRIQVRGSAGTSYYSNWKELSEAVMRPSPEIQEELFANGITHVKINGQWTTDTAHLYTTQWDTI